MNDTFQRYLTLGSDLTRATLDSAERAFEQLVRQGESAAERAEQAVAEMLSRSERTREALAGLARSEVERAVENLGFVRLEELERLQRELDALRAANTAEGDEAAKPPTAGGERNEAPTEEPT